MMNNKRLVVLGRDAGAIDQLGRHLEAAGYIVSTTTIDGVAIDLVGSSSYDAMLITRDVPETDRRYVAMESRRLDGGLAVLTVNSSRSVLTQLQQAL